MNRTVDAVPEGPLTESSRVRACLDALLRTNAAPILLIDPERDGAIVGANVKAAEFYGYDRDTLTQLHVWDINVLERAILPVMKEISSWAGGHHPQRFRHRRADGTVRDVQVYAGPIHVDDRRLLFCMIHDVSAVIEVELFNRLLLESAEVGFCGIDLNGDFSFVNPAAAAAFGFRHESELMRTNIRRFLPDDRAGGSPVIHPILKVAATGQPVRHLECQLYRGDGTPFPARIVANPLNGPDRILGTVISFLDLTGEKELDARIADVADSLPGAVFQAVVGADGRIWPTYLSAAANTLFGLPDGADVTSLAIIGNVVDRRDRAGMWRGLRRAARLQGPWEREFRIGSSEEVKWMLARARPRIRGDGAVVFNGVLLDITERKRLEAALEQAAHRDVLTGVWNRRRLEQALDDAAARCSRYGRPYSLALIDIDHFKRLNDTHGHGAGDEALRILANALAKRVRQSDCLGRWGGEEFALLMPETGMETAHHLASMLRQVAANASIPGVGTLTVSIGVGEALRGEAVHAFFNRVDTALYQAKAGGRDRVACAILPGSEGTSVVDSFCERVVDRSAGGA